MQTKVAVERTISASTGRNGQFNWLKTPLMCGIKVSEGHKMKKNRYRFFYLSEDDFPYDDDWMDDDPIDEDWRDHDPAPIHNKRNKHNNFIS
jgi:hypothetical protein